MYHISGLIQMAALILVLQALFFQVLALPATVTNDPLNITATLSARDDRWFPETEGCSSAQKSELEKSFDDLRFLITYADGRLGDGWETKNGYTHYFNKEDHSRVQDGFQALLGLRGTEDDPRWKFICVKDQKTCDPGKSSGKSFAVTIIAPEDYEDPDYEPPIKKGVRSMLICPFFFEAEQTKRHLPGPFPENEGKEEFCKNKDKKFFQDFETGGHTILHEVTHLDTFGLAAGYPAKEEDSFEYHGTEDWRGLGDAKNARKLKRSKAKDKIDTWQNAESFAAMATELLVGRICDIDDIRVKV